jgi:hypothetical protein
MVVGLFFPLDPILHRASYNHQTFSYQTLASEQEMLHFNQKYPSHKFWSQKQWKSWEICTGAVTHSHGVLHRNPTGAIENRSRGVSHGMGTILHGENEVFQSNRNDFPKVSFILDGIWRHIGTLFCNFNKRCRHCESRLPKWICACLHSRRYVAPM